MTTHAKEQAQRYQPPKLKRWSVAVVVRVTTYPRHWWQDCRAELQLALVQNQLAEDEDTAEALGIHYVVTSARRRLKDAKDIEFVMAETMEIK